MSDRVATSAEVAAALRLSAASVQLYARNGRIPFDTTPGGHRRYDITEVQIALAGDVGDTATEVGRARARGLGRGVPAPVSDNATLLRGLRAARPEPRPAAKTVAAANAGSGSALGSLVAHARRVSLSTVSA